MSRYCVTGCAGFIGSHLVEALLVAGHDVVGVDAFTDYYPVELKRQNVARSGVHLHFDLVEGDLASRDFNLDTHLRGCDGVFHLAAQPGVRASWDRFRRFARNNLLASQVVFEACERRSIPVVWASSSSVYGQAVTQPTPEHEPLRPLSPYGVTKAACEHLAESYRALGLRVLGLRYFTVYGEQQRPDMAFSILMSRALDGDTFYLYGDGEQVRDFTYIRDAVEATILAMERFPDVPVLNVGGGQPSSLNDVIRHVENMSGRTVQVSRGQPSGGDPRSTSADVTLAEELLGWRPATRITHGLDQQWSAQATSREVLSLTT